MEHPGCGAVDAAYDTATGFASTLAMLYSSSWINAILNPDSYKQQWTANALTAHALISDPAGTLIQPTIKNLADVTTRGGTGQLVGYTSVIAAEILLGTKGTNQLLTKADDLPLSAIDDLTADMARAESATSELALPFADEALGTQIESVVTHLDDYGTPPPGVAQGGLPDLPGTYGNRSGALPDQPLGYYTESDVWPSGAGVKRAGERIVVGQGGEVYYSPDHYSSFVRIR